MSLARSDKERALARFSIYFNNLRTFLIFLVVLYHSGLVYESSGIGATFWLVDDPNTNDFSGLINLVIDIFVMSAIFFISGYFTPSSLEKHKGWLFVKTKIKKLLVPWAIAVFTLIPLYKFIFLNSRELPQENWLSYFYFSNDIFGQSWLWFLPVLFLFDLIYFFSSKAGISLSGISLKKAIVLIFITGLSNSVLMAVFDFSGWTKTPVIDFQNERLVIYFMMFLLGGLCFKLKVFQSPLSSKKLFNIINAASWLPIMLYIALLIYSLIKPDEPFFSLVADQILIRLFFHLSLLCLLYTAITVFRLHFNTQGRFAKMLSDNSYSVYIIHMIVMGFIASALLNINMPSLVKYGILTISTYIVCNAMVYFYRKLTN